MSSDGRGDSSFFLSTVNVEKLDRSTSGTEYLKHIVSQWTQLQSKLHAVLHKESSGSRLAGCGDYTHYCSCSYWQSLMAISFAWISKWVIHLQSNIHSEYAQSFYRKCPCVPDDITNPMVPISISYIGLFRAKISKNMGVHHTGDLPARSSAKITFEISFIGAYLLFYFDFPFEIVCS